MTATLRVVGVVLYAAFLVTAPFEHHDIVCHVKTPTHCTACTSSAVGAGPKTPVVPAGSDFADAGRPRAFRAIGRGFLLAVRSAGRSPPADA